MSTKTLPPAGAIQAHRARVQALEQLGDARVERREGEEALVAQARQDRSSCATVRVTVRTLGAVTMPHGWGAGEV